MRAPVLFYGHLHSKPSISISSEKFFSLTVLFPTCLSSHLLPFHPSPYISNLLPTYLPSFRSLLPTFLLISSTYFPLGLFYLPSITSLFPTYLPSHLFTYLPLHFVLYYYCLQHIVCHRFPLLSIFSCSYYV